MRLMFVDRIASIGVQEKNWQPFETSMFGLGSRPKSHRSLLPFNNITTLVCLSVYPSVSMSRCDNRCPSDRTAVHLSDTTQAAYSSTSRKERRSTDYLDMRSKAKISRKTQDIDNERRRRRLNDRCQTPLDAADDDVLFSHIFQAQSKKGETMQIEA